MNPRWSWAWGQGPWACVLIGALSITAAAQQTEKPVFRAGTNVVRLDVRVVDGDGKPITDLRQDEIAVVDAGSARPILLFHKVGSGRNYVEAAQRTIASEVSTNQGAPQGQLFVLVFDQDHIRSGGEQPVRIAAEAFLRERLRPEDRVAIYALPGPGPWQGFTKDVAAARRQLALVHGSLERQGHGGITEMSLRDAYEIVHGNEQAVNKYLSVDSGTEASNGASQLIADQRGKAREDPGVARALLRENAQIIINRADADTRRFLVTFGDLLRTLGTIDGRKTVMLFSEGFYGDRVSRELEDVAAAAAASYSVIYAFDLNKRNDFASAAESTSSEGSDITTRLDPIGGLAAETSGELIKDASVWTKQALASVLPEDETYYVLGFAGSAPETGDSSYRRVSISTSRPGARVIARTGYSRPDSGKADPGEARRAIDAAFSAPFTQQGLKIEYTTFVTDAVRSGPQRVVLSLAAELPVRATADDAADVKCMVRESRSGALVDNGAGRMLLPARADGGYSTGRASWLVSFDLPPADYLMRCVVRESGGVIGSADRRFSVRAVGGPGVTSTDLLLRTPGETLPVRARGYTTGALSGTLRVYGSSGDKLRTVNARLELTPATTDETSRTGRTIDGVVGDVAVQPNGAARREVLFSMPLENLPAGDYIVRAIVRVDGEIIADTGRPVELIDGSEPAAAAPPSGRDPRGVLKGAFAQRIIQYAGTLPDQRYREAAAQAAGGQWTAVTATLAPLPATDAIALRLRGLAQLAREDYVGAAAALTASFDQRNDADVAIVLGWARIGANDLPGAVSAFRGAALVQPDLEPAYEALSNTYLMAGQRALAIQALKQGLERLPTSVRLNQLLGEINK